MKARAESLQARAQLAMVVDLAVEDDAQLAVDVGHGLRPFRAQIDDGQAARGQSDAPVAGDPHAGGVGTARPHALVHGLELRAVHGRRAVAVGKHSGDAAHR